MVLSRREPNVEIRVNGVLEPQARLISVTEGLGGDGVCSAQFEVRPLSTNIMLSENNDLESLLGQNQLVEIRMDGSLLANWPVHRGRITGGSLQISEGGEKVVYTSRLDDLMFGGVVADKAQMNVSDITLSPDVVSSFEVNDKGRSSLVFNPIIDGRPHPNKSSFTKGSVAGGVNAKWIGETCILDPRSVPGEVVNKAIKDRADETAVVTNPQPAAELIDYWSLAEIVRYLCVLLGSGTYVEIPSLASILTVISEDATKVRDLRVPRGLTLPQALDTVLKPHGYYWWTSPSTLASTMIIHFAERGETNGLTTQLNRQATGAALDDSLSEVWRCNLNYNIGRKYVSNNTIYGAPLMKEGTFELVPAWTVDDPSIDTPSKLLGNQADWPETGGSYRGVAGRKWVLNETGEYNDLNPSGWYTRNDWLTTQRDKNVEAFDFTSFWFTFVTESIRMRSRFYPTVTMNKRGTGPAGQDPGGVLLEYGIYDSNSGYWKWAPVSGYTNGNNDDAATGNAAFHQIPGGLKEGYRLLDGECGIMFDSPPLRLMAINTTSQEGYDYHPRLRITASLVADDRLVSTQAAAGSITVDTDYGAMDMTQYKLKEVEAGGPYESVFHDLISAPAADGPMLDGSVNDQQALDDYNQGVVIQNYSQAELSGTVELNSMRTSDRALLGYHVTSINGLNFGMRTNNAAMINASYPIIKSVKYDSQEQKTVCTLGAM